MSQRVLILNFHGIGRPIRPFWPKEDAYWVEKPFFEAVLDEVRGRNNALVTFDDANASDYETALPALLERGLKAHFYIVADFINRRGFLSKAAVRDLHDAGMIVGNHGKTHRSWRTLTNGELEGELVEARHRLEDLISDRVNFAACPNGSYDRRVLKRLHGCGYERVYTSDEGWARRDLWLQARNSLVNRLGLDDLRRLLDSNPAGWKGLLQICKRAIKRWR